ncbi:hypothetical protein PVAP13_3KG464900 [Panicum virgatum]|uniref:UBP-type domain-containing protein n=1 Tax=Panicum virgatum TaxID=38727 RepID=A0A8T0V9M7_PANVG|nr:hypothetical protein PVAP13_3KG464900 [Panicum virgatum]
MSSAAGEDSSSSRKGKEKEEDGAGGAGESHREEGVAVVEGEVDLGDLYGAAAGWVEARTSCPHLGTMPPAGAADLEGVPPPDSPCSRCHHPAENWLCLICKDVLCSRFINKHMLCHYQEKGHCLALSFRYRDGRAFRHGHLLIIIWTVNIEMLSFCCFCAI